jgi:hypothetical protein
MEACCVEPAAACTLLSGADSAQTSRAPTDEWWVVTTKNEFFSWYVHHHPGFFRAKKSSELLPWLLLLLLPTSRNNFRVLTARMLHRQWCCFCCCIVVGTASTSAIVFSSCHGMSSSLLDFVYSLRANTRQIFDSKVKVALELGSTLRNWKREAAAAVVNCCMTRARGKKKFFRPHASTKQDLEIEHICHETRPGERQRHRERFFANNTGELTAAWHIIRLSLLDRSKQHRDGHKAPERHGECSSRSSFWGLLTLILFL